MSYEELITENKKEANFENLKTEINFVEEFINKYLRFVSKTKN